MLRGDITLTALRVSNGARNGTFPARLKILDWGRNETLKGTFVVDEGTAEMFAASQKALGKERVALDYEHNTVPGSEEFNRTVEPRPVAAYWTPKVIPGEGVILEAPDWTPSGKLNAHNYEDLSAAPIAVTLPDGTKQVIGLHSAALTRAGASDVTFFSAGNAEVEGAISILSATHNKGNQKNMEKQFITIAELALAVGLKAEATKEEVLKRVGGAIVVLSAGEVNPITKLTEDVKVLVGLADRVKAAEAKLGDLPKSIAQLSMTQDGKQVSLSVDDLVGRLTKLEAKQVETLAAAEAGERAGLISRAAREGKVIPLSVEAVEKLPLPALREMVGKLPANVVPLNARNRVQPGAATTAVELKGYDRVKAAFEADRLAAAPTN